MDQVKYETDKLCADAALVFRKRRALMAEVKNIDARLVALRNAYRDAMRVKGISVDHFEKACEMRGVL